MKPVKLKKGRFWLFNVWCAIFFIYIALFLLVGYFRPEIDFAESQDAAWRSGYIMLPILSAFASFWFVPQANKTEEERSRENDEEVDPEPAYAIFALTALVHG